MWVLYSLKTFEHTIGRVPNTSEPLGKTFSPFADNVNPALRSRESNLEAGAESNCYIARMQECEFRFGGATPPAF